ncbi:hypothetical protein ACXX9E_29725 [Pseudomonas sp. GNP014]
MKKCRGEDLRQQGKKSLASAALRIDQWATTASRSSRSATNPAGAKERKSRTRSTTRPANLCAGQEQPDLEVFRKKGIEVLAADDLIDELVDGATELIDGKTFVDVAMRVISIWNLDSERRARRRQKKSPVEEGRRAPETARRSSPRSALIV